MLVAIGLVYLIMVILFRSLLVSAVILCALPLAHRARDLDTVAEGREVGHDVLRFQ